MNYSFIMDYLAYRRNAVSQYSIHPPFIYDIVNQSIRKKLTIKDEPLIIDCKSGNLKNSTMIEVTDLGTAYSGNRHYQRTVSSIARHSSKPLKYARLLYRLAHYFSPKTILELGTSFGYSSMYLASAIPAGRLITIEGCPNTAAIAKKNFVHCGFNNIILHTGNFDELLPTELSNSKPDFIFLDGNHQYEATLRYFNEFLSITEEHTVIIFDDIYWSAGMKKAWTEIKDHPGVTSTIDVFMFGIIFFRKGLTKQHFKVRF